MEAMLGMVFMIPWSWAPVGYQRCQGQTLALQQYAALYSLMGTIYGGNATTNFMLPNMQCRTPIGYGANTIGGVAVTSTIGQSGGAFAATLSVPNLPPHIHAASFTSSGTGGPVTVSGTASLPVSAPTTLSVTADAKIAVASTAGRTQTLSANAALTSTPLANAAIYVPNATPDTVVGPAGSVTGNATGTVSGTASGAVTLTGTAAAGGGSVVVGPTGSGLPFNTVSPYLTLNFIICTEGLYPSRN